MDIWFLLIDHHFQAIGGPFLVDSTSDSTIEDLKERVVEERPGALSRTDTNPADLTVWRCMDPTTSFNDEDLERQTSEVLFSNSVKILSGRQAIAELNISKNEILFVKLPGRPGTSRISTAVRCVLIQAIAVMLNKVGDPITSQMVREYEHCFLYADSKGGFTEDDIGFNDIMDPDFNDRDAPEFVKKYKQMLGRKRKVADNVRSFLSYHVFSF
ncbi:hypothetical protein EDB84DRAFT_483214 [Lactarius hengduanensis]|nr:hypothetical protein EDB84DRAFT_483214 [Lactarius hengduanensis]